MAAAGAVGYVYEGEQPRKERSTPRYLYLMPSGRYVVAVVPEVGSLAFPAHPGGDVAGALAAGGCGSTTQAVLEALAEIER